VSLCFSPDGRLIAAQSGAPEWMLVVWVWEKAKLITAVKATNQVPADRQRDRALASRQAGRQMDGRIYGSGRPTTGPSSNQN
jgi:hypothetical protein